MPHAMTLLLAADTETAVEHADVMALNLLPAITSMVVFLLAFGFLYLKVWPKILGGLEDRDQKIRQEIANAEAAREQANAALAEYQKELASARQEATELIAQARADAKAVAKDLTARHEAHLARSKHAANRELARAQHDAPPHPHATPPRGDAMLRGVMERQGRHQPCLAGDGQLVQLFMVILVAGDQWRFTSECRLEIDDQILGAGVAVFRFLGHHDLDHFTHSGGE